MRLDDCITRAARTWPGRPATSFLDRSRTWRQVAEDIRVLAADLRALGIEPGDRVAVLGENSDRYLDTFFAVSWVGAVIVPLNTRLTDDELAACLADSGAILLVSDEDFARRTAVLAAAVPRLRHGSYLGAVAGLRGGAAGGRSLPRLRAPNPRGGDGDAPAGVFYTGGTTGRPKGVVLSHDNLLANAWHVLPALGWNQDTVFLHAAPMFHLADICCLVAVSVVAGRHVIVPGFAADTVIKAIDAHDVTALGLVPTMIGALIASPALAASPVSSLTSILYGGSPMPGELIARTRRALPGVRLWQAYGQTEAAPVLTLLAPDQHTPGGKAGSAGLPVPGCQVSIRDAASGKERPAGQLGEICGRGDNVMIGYWNQPELSGTVLRDGWLYTGDVGYLDQDGYLYVTGRLDEMIITGGENVYPAEIEYVLRRHDGVAEAAVTGVADARWGQRIHAVIVPEPGKQPDAAELITFCREQLAGYKCPRSVEFRDSLPVTGAGKIDKRLLASTATADG
jgi:long-chain acyl-CoA synthetase